jgi:hypothetical protein
VGLINNLGAKMKGFIMSMRILFLMLLSTNIWAQKFDREKIRYEYALEFVKDELRAYDKIMERLTHHPVFFGDVFESPREFTIYKVDCPPETFSLDSDMYLTVPVGTKIRLNGEELIGRYRMYELRIELGEHGVIRTYLHAYELDDLFWPANERDKASFYMTFEKRKREIVQKLMVKYKVSAKEIASTLGDMN